MRTDPDRAGGDGRVEIRPLTPEQLPDLAALFQQGGDPKWCWCAAQGGLRP